MSACESDDSSDSATVSYSSLRSSLPLSRHSTVKTLLRNGSNIYCCNASSLNLVEHMDLFLPACGPTEAVDEGGKYVAGSSKVTSVPSSRAYSTSIEGDEDSCADDTVCVGNHGASSEAGGSEIDSRFKLRKDAKKVRRLLAHALSCWSPTAQRVWSKEGRRFADWFLDVEVGNMPEEVKMYIMSFCTRQDWIDVKAEGQDEVQWLKSKKEEEAERDRILQEDDTEKEDNRGARVASENPYVGMYF